MTGLSNDSDVAVYGPALILQPSKLSTSKCISVSIITSTFHLISRNKRVVHSIEKVWSALSAMRDMVQQCMLLVMNVSNVMAVSMVVGHSICLSHSFSSVFYIIVSMFNIRAASPPFSAYVLFCQLFASLDRIYFPSSANIDIHDASQALLLLAHTLSGGWNLDIGRYIIPPFCVSENLTTYHSLFLDLILGFYPMMLIFISYILIELHANNFKLIVFVWKPFHKCFVCVRRTWDPRASIVNTFATFLLLSMSKILFISSNPFQNANIYFNYSYLWEPTLLIYNPNISTYSLQNIPFIALGISLLIIFALIPTFLFCCYQAKIVRMILFKFLCYRRKHTFDVFMDAFQSH